MMTFNVGVFRTQVRKFDHADFCPIQKKTEFSGFGPVGSGLKKEIKINNN